MIFYVCDGEIPQCEGYEGCYINGGECSHTIDIRHAKNFTPDGEIEEPHPDYWENVKDGLTMDDLL